MQKSQITDKLSKHKKSYRKTKTNTAGIQMKGREIEEAQEIYYLDSIVNLKGG